MRVNVRHGKVKVLQVLEIERTPTVLRFDIDFLTKFPKVIRRGHATDSHMVELGVQEGVTVDQDYGYTNDTYLYFERPDIGRWNLIFEISRYNGMALFYLPSYELFDNHIVSTAWTTNEPR